MIAFIPLLSLKTCFHITNRIVHSMANMQVTTWIVEHTHSNIFWFLTSKVSFIDLRFVPDLLPLRLNVFWIISLHQGSLYQRNAVYNRATTVREVVQ